jgi:flagellar basal body-associated protein FliL
MAEEKKDNGKPQEPAAAAPKVKKGLPKTLIIVIAVTVVEGGLFFGAMKMFGGGPQVAHGAAEGKDVLKGDDPHKSDTIEAVEIELLTKFRVPNDKSGALFIYDLDLYVKVAKAKQAAIETLVSSRKGELSDRVARIIRGNDAAVLNEADLKTLRTQVRNTLGDLAGDPEIIQEVLIPRCVPMRTE